MGTASGLNHFCDLKTCKNRIFSKEIFVTLVDPVGPGPDTILRKGLIAHIATSKSGTGAGDHLNLLLRHQNCQDGSFERDDGQK